MPDCAECSRDLSQICEKGHHSGIGQDGFYAPFAAVDIRSAVLVPDGMLTFNMHLLVKWFYIKMFLL